ncbi:MAG: hypothetical protein ACRD88_05735 [Terriglobia bacterium]
MTAFSRNPGVRAALLALALGKFGLGAELPAQRPEVAETGRNPAPQSAQEQDSRPSLRFGDPTRAREREAAIPIHFVPRRDQPVGSVWADITIPAGPWRFQRAEAAPRSGWRVSATQKRQPARASQTANAGTEIELTVTAGRRAIPEGLLGFLRFRLDAADSPLPTGLSVPKIETAAPNPEDAQAPASFPPTFSDPTLAPGVTCFFFSH